MKSSLHSSMRFSKRAKFHSWCGSMRSCFFTCFFLLVVSLMADTETIKIKSISVPANVDGNSSDPLNLDCVIELDSGSQNQNLVIKWILNDDLIYQWTPQKTYVSKLIKNRTLEAQKNVTISRVTHVPLTILNKTIELSGLYECQVSRVMETDSKLQYMQVYVPAKNIDLETNMDKDNRTLNITCHAEGLYPEPTISLTANNEELDNATEYVVRKNEQLYDAGATFTIDLERLKPLTTFVCSLTISGVNRTYSKSLPYSKSGYDGASTSSSFQGKRLKNGADPSGASSNINLMLALLSAAWLFTSAINRASVDWVKS